MKMTLLNRGVMQMQQIHRGRIVLSVVLLWSVLGIALESQATVIRYTFNGATFEDGAILTGFFDWDTSLPDIVPEYTGASENFEMSVSGGNETTFPAFTYMDEVEGPMSDIGATGGRRILRVGSVVGPSKRGLNFIPDATLGTIGIDLNIPLFNSPGNSTEVIAVSGFAARDMASGGSLTGVIIPEPSTVLLAALAVGGLLFRRRR